MLQVQRCMRIKLTIVCKDATATAYTSTVLHWAFSTILHVLPVVQCACVSCVLHHTEWGSSLDVIGEWDYSGILTTTVLHGPCCAVLCCAVLCCAVLCCAVLCCAVLCGSIQACMQCL